MTDIPENTHLEDNIKQFLQKYVRFTINKKVLREGRLVLYNVKDFYITFIINTNKGQTKTYEVPVPYHNSVQGPSLIFDYSIQHITRDNSKTLFLINQISGKVGKKSKFFDSILTIAPPLE